MPKKKRKIKRFNTSAGMSRNERIIYKAETGRTKPKPKKRKKK